MTDEFFESMLEELLSWRWDSATSQASVDRVEEKWRARYAELKRTQDELRSISAAEVEAHVNPKPRYVPFLD